MNTCSQCDRERPVVMYLQDYWCHDCRRVAVNSLPSLPVGIKTRREIVVKLDEKTYRFRSKSEARRTARQILRCKRLPSTVSAQIEGR